MNVSGIEKSAYYMLNPIWVNVTDVVVKLNLEVELSGEYFNFTFTPFGGEVEFDLAPIIRGIVPNLKGKVNILNVLTIDGSYKVNLKLTDEANTLTDEEITKYFVIGGEDEFSNNLSVPTNLSLTNYYWRGYPKLNYIFKNGQIGLNNDDLIKLEPRHNCQNLFIFFRNMKGGISSYLFEDFNFQDGNKDLGYYLVEKRIKDSGVETSKKLIVRSQVKREFYETIEHLGKSFEIYYQDELGKIKRLSGNNDVSFNYKKPVSDVSLEFDVVINSNKAL